MLTDKSLELAASALGDLHPTTMGLRMRKGRTLHRLGRFEESRALLRRALDDCEREFGPSAPETLECCLSLSHPLMPLGEPRESTALIRRTVAGRTATLGATHPLTLLARKHLLGTRGPDLTTEVTTGPALVEDCRRVLGPHHPITMAAEHEYAFALFHTGSPAEALPLARSAFDSHAQRYGPEYQMTLNARSILSRILAELGEVTEAIHHAEEVVEARTKVLGADHPWTVVVREHLARYRESAGR
ncbi:tetratricopeptide repeat protein [Streptomyces sp. NPDC054796]